MQAESVLWQLKQQSSAQLDAARAELERLRLHLFNEQIRMRELERQLREAAKGLIELEKSAAGDQPPAGK